VIWVIDASVAVRWLLEDESHPNAQQVLERIVDMPEHFAVPELFGFETFSVLQRLHPDGIDAFCKGIIPILQSGVFRQPMTKELASKAAVYINSGLTGYDACYAALASDLNGVWLTFDRKAHILIRQYHISCLLEEALPAEW
jgi:predicted nucleic acid-binding protein